MFRVGLSVCFVFFINFNVFVCGSFLLVFAERHVNEVTSACGLNGPAGLSSP